MESWHSYITLFPKYNLFKLKILFLKMKKSMKKDTGFTNTANSVTSRNN